MTSSRYCSSMKSSSKTHYSLVKCLRSILVPSWKNLLNFCRPKMKIKIRKEILRMMTRCWYLLSKEGLSSIWTSFLESIDKNCLNTNESILNVLELLGIQPETQSQCSIKDLVTTLILHPILRNSKSMTIINNIWKTIKRQLRTQLV